MRAGYVRQKNFCRPTKQAGKRAAIDLKAVIYMHEQGRFDRYVAAGASIILHILMLALSLSHLPVGSERTSRVPDSLISSRAGPTESGELWFRQRIVPVTGTKLRGSDAIDTEEATTLTSLNTSYDAAIEERTESMSSYNLYPSSHYDSDKLNKIGRHKNVSERSDDSNEGVSAEMDLAPLRAQYMKALRIAVLKKWDGIEARINGCMLHLQQEVGGAVLRAQVGHCSIDSSTRDELEAAALMAQPLPYAGYEDVFSTSLDLDL